MAGPISIHDREGLVAAFKAVRPPKNWQNFDLPAESLKIGPVQLGFGQEWYRNLTRNSRFYAAAWAWMRPEIPRRLADLEVLQARVGMNHITRGNFCAGVKEHCDELMRSYPALEHWGASRLALLELSAPNSKPMIPTLLRDSQMGLRTEYAGALVALYHDPAMARESASVLIEQALRGAAQAVMHILAKSPSNCFLTANLMVPVAAPDSSAPRFAAGPVVEENSRKASALWQGEHWTKALVIAAETQGAQHLGFWAPLTRRGNGDALPGAPTAFLRMHGDAVYKDYLHVLPSFDPALAARWKAYMACNLEERLFVSLPLLVPLPPPQGKVAVAVLNVNVDPPPGDDWYRAHHQEWLALALDEAEPFMEIAYRSLQIIMEVDRKGGNAKLLAGPDRWNTIPGRNIPLHLPGERPNERQDETTRLRLPAPDGGGAKEGTTESQEGTPAD